MCQKVVIPGVDPESRPFNRSCEPYLNLDSRFTVRPAGRPGMTRKGFTLIELLVVVLIIGILAAVALPQYQKAVLKARAMQLVTLVRSLKMAEETYYMANGVYTTDFDSLDIELPSGGTVNGSSIVYPNGYSYALPTSADPYSVYGSFGGSNRITWMIYLDNMPTSNKGQTKCYSYSNNPTTEQICQGLGGKDPVDACGGKCRIFTVQ